MQRSKVYLEDILASIVKIERYTKGLGQDSFAKDTQVQDAVIRNLEIIGEAVKRLSPELKLEHPEIEWKKLAGLRDILIHEYAGVDLQIVWDVVANKLPELQKAVKRIAAKIA